ncbi:hypothetical protein K435DRAFT_848542 [Dendrothele bispora CBS 962.96]|uniref:F-box domain-containing protein n=1 Tax=Dendrothele bispora (strain CBS 962.96) TaxID=1314807 RepID=A0A4S8MUS4_DENBC|nr:hypothetical protein K435DRAFT_848542 [Dendrothele bispora CBS 962.96]
MHALFQISELRRLIFEYLEREEQVCCAQVCRAWSGVALDIVWYKVDNLAMIANVLSPVKKIKVGEVPPSRNSRKSYHFECLPGPKAWKRFESMYSNRVRILYHHRADGDCSSILRRIQIIRSSSSQIFPHLHTIHWETSKNTELYDVIMFMHDQVKHFTISCSIFQEEVGDQLPGNDATQLVVEAISTRVPLINTLKLDIALPSEWAPCIAQILRNLHCLKSVQIPSFEDMSHVLSSLSIRQGLKSVELCRYGPPAVLSASGGVAQRALANIGTFRSRLRGGTNLCSGASDVENDAFSSLEHFSALVREYSTMNTFFQHREFHHLRSIKLRVSPVDDSKSVQKLFRAISRNCPSLEKLNLGWDSFRDVQDDVLVLEDIQDILSCKKIKEFEFYAPFMFDFSDEDVEQIALAWPQIHRIVLCPYPVGRQHSNKKLSLWAVFLLIHLCPGLKDVSLCINTRAYDTPRLTPSSLPIRIMTAQSQNHHWKVAELESLVLGYFDLQPGDEFETAELLGQICGPLCQLEYGIDLDDEDEDYDKTEDRWETVKSLFPRFSKIYSSINHLEKELESLRISVK